MKLNYQTARTEAFELGVLFLQINGQQHSGSFWIPKREGSYVSLILHPLRFLFVQLKVIRS